MADNTTTTTTPNAPADDLPSLASALLATSDALDKVNRRICFLGEMMGDKEDGLVLSGNAFDQLQSYLLETAAIAHDALNDITMDYCRAKAVMAEAK